VGVDAGLSAHWAVVATGVDLDRFRPTPDRAGARRLLGLTDVPIAVCVGRLSEAKGQDTLAACWPQVRARVPDAELVLVGDGEMREKVEAVAGEGVHVLGHRDDVTDWYAAADVVVVPSRWDALSLSLVEAAASGCCLVATDVPGAREVLGGEAAGIVPAGDPARLAEAIAQRLADRELAAVEGAAHRVRAIEHFDRRQMFDRLAELTNEVIDERATR
jgi:glycosyltransferase involved in cell wall biosynthesis